MLSRSYMNLTAANNSVNESDNIPVERVLQHLPPKNLLYRNTKYHYILHIGTRSGTGELILRSLARRAAAQLGAESKIVTYTWPSLKWMLVWWQLNKGLTIFKS
ncbi:uncharacterized protein PHALS_10847 [Plasmopara halstedii]|uniref:Uncharacterized protein n=1 Tax=Plasmopara halstedii TaxID=4781 RepID=A0A0P1AII5_PLAHL|nr:uncharacterized protein PHALS_10847 [Plasmopara halstedii]CEG40661.1 hypothetical protein PHALS_10847 [Plasmopara halstedii]|eukprot:XP_024577030.1 hypothetical protein PHALS_10847 [Plasmopara halstedii]